MPLTIYRVNCCGNNSCCSTRCCIAFLVILVLVGCAVGGIYLYKYVFCDPSHDVMNKLVSCMTSNVTMATMPTQQPTMGDPVYQHLPKDDD